MTADDAKSRGAKLLNDMLGLEKAAEIRRHWREICPDFEEYVTRFLSGEIWSRKGLDLRTKSLVTIATTAALGRSRALELNIGIAINNGATKDEIVETLLQVAPYAGFPACWEGLEIAHRVFGESKPTTR